MVRFLHMGDMHLDSPFAGMSVQESEKKRAELRALFSSILSDAAEDGCDAALISGDLFDQGFTNPDTVAQIKEAVAKFGRPVVIAPGNHDPYNPASVWTAGAWPENTRIFSSTAFSSFDLELRGTPVTVWGWAFTSSKLDDCPIPAGFRADAGGGRVNVICAHGDTSSPISRYCPIPEPLITGSGCEYAALGHIHKAPEPKLLGRTLTAYSGFPQGRSWDEPGQGRVLYVDADAGRASIRIHPTGNHRYSEMTADVTGAASDEEVCGIVASSVAGDIYPSTSLRVTLTGAVPPSYRPDTAAVARSTDLPDGITLSVTDATSPVYGADYLMSDLTVRGELYRSLLPGLGSADPDIRRASADALRIGLLALDGKAFMQ